VDYGALRLWIKQMVFIIAPRGGRGLSLPTQFLLKKFLSVAVVFVSRHSATLCYTRV